MNLQSKKEELEKRYENITNQIQEKQETVNKEIAELIQEQCRLQGEYRLVVELLNEINNDEQAKG
jgi:hypothetical protein